MAAALKVIAEFDNATVETDGTKVVITIKDMNADLGPSGSFQQSGKGIAHVVANTGGFMKNIPGTNGLMLNVYAGRK